MFRFRQIAARVGVSLPFRILVAVACLVVHLVMLEKLAHDRFDWKFDQSPATAPGFADPHGGVHDWDRLIVSRWDSEHYEGLALRGFTMCKDKDQLPKGAFPDDDHACQLGFYPGYPLIGRAVMKVLHVPIDYALFYVSLAASFLFLLMWTSRPMIEGLGLGGTYLSLLLFNTFTSGFTLVTVYTEPCLLALSLAAFLCLHKRWLLVGALLAGAATVMRITGAATGFAYCAGLLVLTLMEHPKPNRVWWWRAALAPISGWGVIALMGYFQHRFGDALIYGHAHVRAYGYAVGLAKVLIPDGRLLMQSIWAEPYDGIFLAAALLWFALGHKQGLRRFKPESRAYWYTFYFGVVGLTIYGSVSCAYCGSTRYMLVALPLFFAMAGIMKNRPVVLALWLFMSTMHYYHGSACVYLSQRVPDRRHKCTLPLEYRSSDLAAGKE
ncbi:MAG TPA: hypothetical protein VMI75_25560 [Polyangiaceae bacterium]|nr:hypothetical protein [Polyangiaceae bacterium]